MPKASRIFAHVSRALAAGSLAALVACSAAPGEEPTGGSSEALSVNQGIHQAITCGSLQVPVCTQDLGSDPGEGPGGSNLGGSRALETCVCESCGPFQVPESDVCADVTTPATGTPSSALTCGGTAPIPSQLAGQGCTLGVTYSYSSTFHGMLSQWTATVWACPSTTPLPSPMFGNPSCSDAYQFPCEDMASGASIDNACVGGTASSAWTLIEDVIIYDSPTGRPTGCSGGCSLF